MHSSISLELKQKSVQNFKQLQHLIMSRQMQQAFHLLQVPVMELSPVIEMEIKQNPVLDYIQEGDDFEDEEFFPQEIAEKEEMDPEKELQFNENDFEILCKLGEEFGVSDLNREQEKQRITKEQGRYLTYLESSITAHSSLFEHLMRQASEVFNDSKEFKLAESLIGNLDSNGYLNLPLQEIAILDETTVSELERILSIIQTFQPCGVGARTIQESLLLQLAFQGKENGLAYAIIEKEFNGLMHNRIQQIAKSFCCSSTEVEAEIDSTIAKLDLHPGSNLSLTQHLVSYIVPDLILKEEGGELTVELADESMPRLRLNGRYLCLLQDESISSETKEFIQKKVNSAKWLIRNLLQRNDTLEKIALSLVKRQRDFFSHPEGKLTPLTMKMVANELGMHESTVARAVSNKYIQTPRGLLTLRFFFTNALQSEKEEVSSNTVRELVKEMIAHEDKKHPLSDSVLSHMLQEKGIRCARRTVAKYRAMLQIGTLQQRRKF